MVVRSMDVDTYYSDSETLSSSYVEEYEPTNDDVWKIIDSFFTSKGLVAHQLDSFNEFIEKTVQRIVLTSPPIIVERSTDVKRDRVQIEFKQMYIRETMFKTASGVEVPLRPAEARLRNQTYQAPILCDIGVTYSTEQLDADGQPTGERDEKHVVANRYPIAEIPVMVRSKFCLLSKMSEEQRIASGECKYDCGGYFVVNGSEKVLIAQERIAFNNVFVFRKSQPSKFSYTAECHSSPLNDFKPAQNVFVTLNATTKHINVSIPYIRQEIPLGILFRALNVVKDKDMIERIVYDLGDTEMLHLLDPSLEEAVTVQDSETALDWIGRRGNAPPGTSRLRRIAAAAEVIRIHFLPHIGTTAADEKRKGFFLGYMVYRLLSTALGRRDQDDRDHMGNKRMDLAGVLMSQLFRTLFRKLQKSASSYTMKVMEQGSEFRLADAVRHETISNGLRYCVATGNWGVRSGGSGNDGGQVRSGVSQVLSRLTFAAALSHLRRLNSPIDRSGKLARPRQLHSSQWGIVCPSETPEGESVGLTKNLSMMAIISSSTPDELVIQQLDSFGMERLDDVVASDLNSSSSNAGYKVFVNGSWLGQVHDIAQMVAALRSLRRSTVLMSEVGITMDTTDRELRIWTDPGRCMRPLFVVEEDGYRLKLTRAVLDELDFYHQQTGGLEYDGSVGLGAGGSAGTVPAWDQVLIPSGCVEYMDVEEEETTLIAMDFTDLKIAKQARRGGSAAPGGAMSGAGAGNGNMQVIHYTHCEIHPSLILGVACTIIPFPDHNQSPRNTYQGAMGKQALGIYMSNYPMRFETMAHVLYYPQRPLVCTRGMKYLHFKELPAGQNVCVAIGCYSGYNQEDSVILNQSSIDRGLFRTLFTRTYVTTTDESSGEAFEKPDRATTTGIKHGSYDKIDDDGLAIPGMRVSGEDVIIGKTTNLAADEGTNGASSTTGELRKFTKRDISVSVRSNENGMVDSVLVADAPNGGGRLCKVRIRNIRVPQIGDKFSSRHGQKGTCGITYRQEDLPWTREGIVPDIIINPHAIPSRMTIGQLVECLLGKVGAMLGLEGDATAFNNEMTVDRISSQLHSLGYQKWGNETMFSGHSGRRLQGARLFFGPTYYQRLKHMVDDKIHSRGRGPVQNLVRQPMEGRAREGGLRFGEMERDCMISHGSAYWLKERLCSVSDECTVYVCDLCGLVAVADLDRKIFECRSCRNNTRISCIKIPYAFKLLVQELMAVNVVMRLMTR